MKNRVTDLFLRAVELSSDEQPEYLERACPDPDVRAEVTSLLRHHRDDTLSDPAGRAKLHARRQELGVGTLKTHATTGVGQASERERQLRRIAAVVLIGSALGAAWLGYRAARTARRVELAEQLSTITRVNAGALRGQIEAWAKSLEHWAGEPALRAYADELATKLSGQDPSAEQVRELDANRQLYELLEPLSRQPHILGLNLLSREGFLISYELDGPVATMQGVYQLTAEGGAWAAPGFMGQTVFAPPFSGKPMVARVDGQTTTTHTSGGPGTASQSSASASGSVRAVAAAPVRNPSGRYVAVLGARIATDAPFADALRTATVAGAVTFAFNSDGVLASPTIYDDEFRRLGLLPETTEVTGSTILALRTPDGPLGELTAAPPDLHSRPLTRMATQATAGVSGVDVDGYLDFRGERVVGAWEWIPEFSLGVATEMDLAVAYAPLRPLRWTLGLLLAICAGLGTHGLLSAGAVANLRARLAGMERLGSYQLQERIGEGGTAEVFRGRHALIRRPVAIKVLKAGSRDPENVARFEREAQLIARLNHESTVRLFDFGQTADGRIFYVMELVDGMALSRLVDEHGPQAPNRVIHVLIQVASSLAEAHRLGIVHRDIKPSNIMLMSREDALDAVKVLDFGLARAAEDAAVTSAHLVPGTPAYIDPARILDPQLLDPRSDVYALAAVAYYMLTGQEAVGGDSSQEVLLRAVHAEPAPPGSLAAFVPPELDVLIMRCLDRDPEKRPSAVGLIRQLEQLRSTFPWSHGDAHNWWTCRNNERPGSAAAGKPPAGGVTQPATVRIRPARNGGRSQRRGGCPGDA